MRLPQVFIIYLFVEGRDPRRKRDAKRILYYPTYMQPGSKADGRGGEGGLNGAQSLRGGS